MLGSRIAATEGQSRIIIYETEGGDASLEVQLENDTVWLTQAQMADLFGKERSVISKHLNHVFRENELEKEGNVHFLHIAFSDKPVAYYSLDVIISVGYRVKSKRGTQFRIWATKKLKDVLVRGFAIQDKIKFEQLQQLKETVGLLSNVLQQKELTVDEANGLLLVVTNFAYALDLLDKYDHQNLTIESTSNRECHRITYQEAISGIKGLRIKFGDHRLFGNEKDDSFKGSIENIYQTFDGVDLYQSIEEKAAHLLYFVVKNHSFSDGNKRIAALIFIWFMERNKILYKSDGSKRMADNALVALTLMIAESRPEEKDTMIKVVVSLINQRN
ncbi:virulence protein RhuM/Fic/DOC family protein [Dyadobacter arcticus]|uniref:Prophage maintenance system killer protein n=1 Tax=Dyadobacter arcticus TaxID=1078754 RepID=A0ABX0UV49_9BACT|nr:virulence protein RhuM/Fic/DOC family protein [Dyadobacter arcticus]NIJ55764.1 prophage maintenance system killer protein [Dyadobacter arcticus]